MANEKRLIDANAIEAKIEKNFRRLVASQNKPDLAAALSYVGDLIIEAPTEDAEIIVNEWECETYNDCAKCPRMTDDGCVSLSKWLKQPAEGE